MNLTMHHSPTLKSLSLLLSGLILIHSVLFFKIGAPGLFLFSSTAFLFILINAVHIRKINEKAASHAFNMAYLIYVSILCYHTGGFHSILILLLVFTPVLTWVFPGKKEKIGYAILCICIFFIFSFGQGLVFIAAVPDEVINMNYFRFIHLFSMMIFFFGCMMVMISEKERIHASLRQSDQDKNRIMDEANEAMKIKDEFLANMSHEIRNPMNGIIGMMHVILDTDLNGDQRKYAQIVYSSARALLTIVNDVLDLSKLRAGKLELDIRNFDLEVSIKDIVALPELQARQKGIDFVHTIAPDVPCLLKGDIGRIRQVINNLTGNAIKFTEQGQVSLAITLQSEDPTTATLHFRVEDTGIGIKEEVIGSLFQSFTQADMSITKKYGGTGLGLAISKMFVEKMNGTIGAESIEMIGSTFFFSLPLEKQAENSQACELPVQGPDEVKILVTTDGLDLGKNFERTLQQLGHNYRPALNETQALALLREALEENRPFDLVIMEAKESDAKAEHLGRQIRQEKGLEETRLILVTSVGIPGDAKRFEELGFSAFLSKPVEKLLLQDCLHAVMTRPAASNGSVLPIITRHSIVETKKHLRHILIVEDMETNRLTAKVLIEKYGYKTDEAQNGQEALEKHMKSHYDIILMDCQMPVMDGFEATRKIRENEISQGIPHTPIIAMTGNAFDSDRQKCFEAGMDDFIAKPVDPVMLSEKIRSRLMDTQVKKEDTIDKSNMETGTSQSKPVTRIDPGSSVSDETDICFDHEKLLERFGGDQETVDIILDSFFQEAPEFLEKIGDAIYNKDLEGIRSNSHALKGAAANVNAEGLRKAAQKMEAKARDGRPMDSFAEFFQAIQTEYQRFLKEANP